MGVATAMIASAAIGAVGSAAAANSAKKAQQGATAANAQAMADTNASNERLFRLSRGGVDPSTGYASAVLPTYFGAGEQQLGQGAMDFYNSVQNYYGGTGGYLNQLRNASTALDPAMQASLQTLGNQYNGQNLALRLQNAAPVFSQRLGAARAQSASIDQAFRESMARLNAERASNGFYGGSTFDRNRLLSSTLGARSNAAALMSSAGLQNAQDERQVRDADLAFKMDPSYLYQAMNAAGNYANAPANAAAGYYSQLMQPFNFFRIGNQAFQQQNMPTISPSIGGGQIAGGAVSSIGSTIANYYAQQQLLQQMQDWQKQLNTPAAQPMYVPSTPSSTPTGGGGYGGFG